ncbi:MAG: ABC transporter ATP-binding protein [Planctomycetota bacterium]
MSKPAIETSEVHKMYSSFGRKVHALRGVTLEVPENSIFGLLGANGAGKTTLLKLMLGLMRPTKGSISVFGGNTSYYGSRRSFGYLPENHKFPQYMTGRDVLEIFAGLSGMSFREARKRVPVVIDQVGLQPSVLTMKVKKYSKGMQQRLGLAQALISNPRVVFLDEPTDGVDPVGRKDIRDLLKALRDEGKTVFLNSHLLSEVELVCDRVAILSQGSLTWEGTVADIQSKAVTYSFFTSQPSEEAWTRMKAICGEPRWFGDHFELDLSDVSQVSAVIDVLRAEEVSIFEVTRKRKSLEDFFIETVSNGSRQYVGPAEGGVR